MSNQGATTNSNSNSKQGIDIREALEILALRNPDDHDHSHDHRHHHQPHSSSLSACHEAPTKDAVHWGQRIELGESSSEDNNNNDDDNVGSHEETMANIEKQKDRIEKERADRRAVIEETLASMSVIELLECVMNSQEERVKTYRNYDKCVFIVSDALHRAAAALF